MGQYDAQRTASQHSDCVVATYLLHGVEGDLYKKAESIALGMTTGSWTDLPAARRAEMERRAGRVVAVEELPPGEDGARRALLSIGYPTVNLTPDIPSILTCTFGKLSMDGRIKLFGLEIPEGWLRRFPGPRLGIEGVRDLLGVHDRPLLMSIFKTVIGLDTETLAEHFYLQAAGGVDLVKDDEIFFADDLAPFEKRIEACRKAAERAAAETGQKVLYAVNLTGRAHELVDKARRAVRAGASCLLLNVLAYGYDVLQALAEDGEVGVPIVAHPALAGAIYPSPHHGIAAPVLLGQLMRLAGADLVLYPSPYGSVAMPRPDALAVADRLREEVPGLRPAFPVPSAGIHPGLVPLLVGDFGRDLVVNAGGGIHGHPGGPTAGGRAFRAAIDAAVRGESLEAAAARSPELAQALEKWGVARR